MLWIYRLLFWPLFLLLLPQYLLKLIRRGGNWHVAERFGKITPPQKKEGVERVWVQAVSVGELNAIGPLLEELLNRPNMEVCLSVTTTTGYRLAQKRYANKVAYLFSFPIDLFSPRVLKKIQPDRCILTEGDMWPEFLTYTSKHAISVYLINARLSDRSYRRFGKIRSFFSYLVNKVTLVLAATRQDAERFVALGANPEFVSITGSLKFDATKISEVSTEERTKLLSTLGWNENHQIILGSSTWPGEEEALIKSYEQLKSNNPNLRLLIVPRHAERGDEIEPLLKPYHYNRRSKGFSKDDVEIVLADTTGELSKISHLAHIVLIGKSMAPNKEGQSPIEAAAAGKPVLMGSGMSNFAMISASLVHAGGGQWVAGPADLTAQLKTLLQDASLRDSMAQKAQAWFAQNKGATKKTLEWLELSQPTNYERTSI